ncbi:MAG: IS1/IS1595 family N-terminal zinc-binding domain-containing protein, partial [bacterium]
MPCYQEVTCPNCGSNRIVKAGKSTKDIQRYTCQNEDCSTKSFMQ